MPASQSIDADTVFKADLEKASKQRPSSVVSGVFEHVKRMYICVEEEEGRAGSSTAEAKALCQALVKLCMSGDSLHQTFQFIGKIYEGFAQQQSHEALRSAWEGACANFEDSDVNKLEEVHKELFDRAQVTTLALELAMNGRAGGTSSSTSTSKKEDYKVKMAEIDAYGAHLVQNDPKEQSSLKEQVEKIKSALQPFIA